ncbi:class I glutamine amidotransferase-like protein [Mycena latifolia]|nr:class I glutamine amidotransferase-like protein [Mycena latifolia]
MPETLSIAVCVSEDVTLSDFVTPMEILAGLNDADHPVFGAGMPEVAFRVAIDYLAPTMDPVVSGKGRNAPTFNPTLTYAVALASGKQFDIIWVPAGAAGEVMSVCGGAVQLAFAGILTGRRATTNKAFYREIVAATPKDIQWVPEARWVVDGNVWTSSGVTAGSDMALAFVEHLVGAKVARFIRGAMEIPEVTEKDDPFAALHGLV